MWNYVLRLTQRNKKKQWNQLKSAQVCTCSSSTLLREPRGTGKNMRNFQFCSTKEKKTRKIVAKNVSLFSQSKTILSKSMIKIDQTLLRIPHFFISHPVKKFQELDAEGAGRQLAVRDLQVSHGKSWFRKWVVQSSFLWCLSISFWLVKFWFP